MYKTLLPLFPRYTAYIEPFCGSCVVLLNKPKTPVEVVNDRDKEIWNLFNVIRTKPQEFKDSFKYMLNSRYQFYLYREQDPEPLSDVQRAVRFFYIVQNAYGGKTQRSGFSVSRMKREGPDLYTLQDKIDMVYERIKNVRIENLDYQECIQRHDFPGAFFYLDPPYYMNLKKELYYTHNFVHEDFLNLKTSLENIKGKFLMTINDCKVTRDLYSNFNQKVIDGVYCLRATEMAKGTCKDGTQDVKQLLVANYDIEPRRFKLKTGGLKCFTSKESRSRTSSP